MSEFLSFHRADIAALLILVLAGLFIWSIYYGRRRTRTLDSKQVFGDPERTLGGWFWAVCGVSSLLLVWFYFSWGTARAFFPNAANEMCQVAKIDEALSPITSKLPHGDRYYKSTEILVRNSQQLSELEAQIPTTVFLDTENLIVEDKNIKWRNLRDNGGESDRGDAKNCFYPIVVKNNKVVGFGDVCKNNFSPKNQTVKNGSDYYVYPIDPKGVEKKWRYARQSVESIINLLRVKENKGQLEIELGKKTESVKTVWHGSKYDSNEHGKKLINSILNDISFDYPKSIWNVYDCISSIINNKKDAIVLDFFAGSGTTGHAVLKLNEEDNGMRQFILCSNNENNIVSKITYPRVKKIIEGYKDNNTKIKINGIKANLKYFKIDFIDAEYNDRNIANLFSKSTDIICIKENSFNLVVNKKDFKIYKNLNHYTGIIYNNLSISEFKNEISSFNKKINIYIFSLGDDDYSDEFEDIEDKIKIFPLPQSIIKMYKKIYNAT